MVKKLIRETVVFAPQDLTADPPFTKMDMVSCRNLLIYFSPELQRKVLPDLPLCAEPERYPFPGHGGRHREFRGAVLHNR